VTYADQPIALAGVMGGQTEAVTEATTCLWLEAAVFAPQAVRRSARSVGLRTEASLRFEKGLPREATLAAADRAVALLVELAGATVRGRWLHQKPSEPHQPLPLRRDALHNLLGPVIEGGEEVDLEDGRIVATLTALGCTLEDDDDEGWRVTVPPSRRMDLLREVDLIEEVARLVGYDRFACHLPDPLEPGGLDPAQRAERRLRASLCAAGLQETCALSLVPGAEGRLPLANPLLADYGHLRDNLHEELLQAARRNLQASQPGFWAYEIGTVFSADGLETRQLVGVISGERRSERWSSSGKPQPPDYFAARGRLQAALDDLKLPVEDRPLRDHPLLHPGRAATVAVEGRPAGWFGQLHPEQAEALDLPEATYLFQLVLAPLLTAATRRNRWQPAFAPFATVPASERDLALVVPRSTQAGELLSAIRKAGKPLLEGAELVDRYSGSQIGAEECSQAFRLRYRDPKRTLTDEQVEAAHAKVRAALEKQFGARLRT
ncbi:MAG: phenylalanine--tRNA ligase subunit beta, partial [Synechococcus sp.]